MLNKNRIYVQYIPNTYLFQQILVHANILSHAASVMKLVHCYICSNKLCSQCLTASIIHPPIICLWHFFKPSLPIVHKEEDAMTKCDAQDKPSPLLVLNIAAMRAIDVARFAQQQQIRQRLVLLHLVRDGDEKQLQGKRSPEMKIIKSQPHLFAFPADNWQSIWFAIVFFFPQQRFSFAMKTKLYLMLRPGFYSSGFFA